MVASVRAIDLFLSRVLEAYDDTDVLRHRGCSAGDHRFDAAVKFVPLPRLWARRMIAGGHPRTIHQPRRRPPAPYTLTHAER